MYILKVQVLIHEADHNPAECPSVRPYIHPKTLQIQATITAGRDCGLAEWIIDDSWHVLYYIFFVLFLLQGLDNSYLNYAVFPGDRISDFTLDRIDEPVIILKPWKPNNIFHALHDDLLPLFNTLKVPVVFYYLLIYAVLVIAILLY